MVKVMPVDYASCGQGAEADYIRFLVREILRPLSGKFLCEPFA